MAPRDMERIKKDIFNALSFDLDRMSADLTAQTHEAVVAAVERRIGGVIARLERGVTAGLQ